MARELIPGIRKEGTLTDKDKKAGASGTSFEGQWTEYKLGGKEKVKADLIAKEILGSTEEVVYACGHVFAVLQGVAGNKLRAQTTNLFLKKYEDGNVLICGKCVRRQKKTGRIKEVSAT